MRQSAGEAEVPDDVTLPIFDAHNDLARDLAAHADEPARFARFWLGDLRAGGVRLQVCPVSVVPHGSGNPRADATAQLRALAVAAAQSPEAVHLVRDRTGLDLAASGAVGLLPAMEGLEALGDDPREMRSFADLGVRLAALTWNTENAFAGGCETTIGLKRAGRDVLGEMHELGIVLDLAHASDATFAEALAAWDGAVLISHTCCRALFPDPRNASDEQMRAVAERDGVVCLMGVPPLLTAGHADVADFVRHVFHAAELVGASHVGIGMDFIVRLTELGATVPPPGEQLALPEVAGSQAMQTLLGELRAAGLSSSEIRAIAWDNLARLFGAALAAPGR